MSRSQPTVECLPAEVLRKITICAGESGPKGLQNLLKSGPVCRDVVLSPESLRRVRLDKTYRFPKCSKPGKSYFSLFCKCLKEHNPYALYAVALRLAFKHSELDAALYILTHVKDVYPHAKLMFVILNYCAGYDCEVYAQECLKDYKLFELENMGHETTDHIKIIGPRRLNTYFPTFFVAQFPECGQKHEWFGEYANERCKECVIYYMARDICQLS